MPHDHEDVESSDADQQPTAAKRPEFSSRLGAPITVVTPTGKPPSQVTGRPQRSAHTPEQPTTDLGHLPGPDGRSVPADPTPDEVDPKSFYAQVGGRATFEHIVDVFYSQVAEDPDFRAMYPDADLEPAKYRLLTFLEQYWGGPRTYQQERGHPRLRMRHMPFRVDAAARDTWLRYMRRAVESAELSPLHEEVLWDYLERAAHSMVNA